MYRIPHHQLSRKFQFIPDARVIYTLLVIISSVTVFAYDDPIRVNFDFNQLKYLTVGETLNITCENTLNNDTPLWTYPETLSMNDPRVKIYFDNGPKSRMEIKNAAADDAGKYGCGIDYEYNGENYPKSITIEVIVNKIYKVSKEETVEGIKLLCDVHAYPSPKIFWKIDYDNKELNPKPDNDYPVPSETKVLVDKTVGRLILRQYNGVNNALLFITNYTKDDDGKYFCHAENIAGNAHEYFRVGHKKKYKLYIEAIATGKSVEPTTSEPESQPSIPDARGDGSDATSYVSPISVACLIGIILGNIMLGIIIYLIVRGNIIKRENSPNDIESLDSSSKLLRDHVQICDEEILRQTRKSANGMEQYSVADPALGKGGLGDVL